MRYFGLEAGGTKFVCAAANGPDDLITTTFATTTPEETLPRAIAFFREQTPAVALGIASFGPVDLDPASKSYGHITSTPKHGWGDCDIVGTFRSALGIPVGFDTDVNAAILAESRWGAARGVGDALYLTIGTGIGGGALVGGALIHGLAHPEMGHIRVPHDRAADPFPGVCPYHTDCLEGLASGPAIEERWGKPAGALPIDHPAWALEADYLALAVANFACTLSPKLVLMGGGVMQQSHLLPMIRERVAAMLNGYTAAPEVRAPLLGNDTGVLGGIALAISVDPAWLGGLAREHPNVVH